MNDRYEQLLAQAHIEFAPNAKAVTKRFAELIVKECADLIDNKVMITAAQTYDEVFVAKFDTKELCAKQIKEHFGVEE